MANCIFCGEEIPSNSKVCPACSEVNPFGLKEDESQRCPYCGESIPLGFSKCPACDEILARGGEITNAINVDVDTDEPEEIIRVEDDDTDENTIVSADSDDSETSDDASSGGGSWMWGIVILLAIGAFVVFPFSIGIFCIIAGVVCIVISFKDGNEARRAAGRRRLNDLLTDFGGGSFAEDVSASTHEVASGCRGEIMKYVGIGLIIIGIAFLSI